MPKMYSDRYGGRADHFAQILEKLLIPAIKLAGFDARPPARTGSENIHAAIINDLTAAEMVLADLSTLNANVFLELGIRTALDKPVCLVSDGDDVLPFDTGSLNTHKYLARPVYELNSEIERLSEHIRASARSSVDNRNPLWKYFGTAAQQSLVPAQINPEDASLEAKVDRLSLMVERLIDAQETDWDVPGISGRGVSGYEAQVSNDLARFVEEFMSKRKLDYSLSSIRFNGDHVEVSIIPVRGTSYEKLESVADVFARDAALRFRVRTLLSVEPF